MTRHRRLEPVYHRHMGKHITEVLDDSVGQWKQEVKVIWQKAPHGGPIPRLGVIPGGRNLYHW